MKPYKNLSSNNLGLLLLLTRITTVVSIGLIILSIFGTLSEFIGPTSFNVNIWSVVGLTVLPYGLIALLCSGIVAAIISFEESYRKKSEAYIESLNEI